MLLRDLDDDLQQPYSLMLPTKHPQIHVTDDGTEVTATFENRRWVIPSGDCRLLPVANTTSELLATYIGERLLTALEEAAKSIAHIRVELDECDGQIGVWERGLAFPEKST